VILALIVVHHSYDHSHPPRQKADQEAGQDHRRRGRLSYKPARSAAPGTIQHPHRLSRNDRGHCCGLHLSTARVEKTSSAPPTDKGLLLHHLSSLRCQPGAAPRYRSGLTR
jgi:hypothetical protein